jgi:energy-coupling factor transporter transmembrane protein EcfT
MLTLFSCSAWVVVGWGIFIVAFLILWGQQTKSFNTGHLVAVLLGGAVLVVSTIAFVLIIFGMAIHCLFNRDLSIGTKTLWSIFAFLTAPFGAAIYFFAVYKKQTKIHREVTNA